MKVINWTHLAYRCFYKQRKTSHFTSKIDKNLEFAQDLLSNKQISKKISEILKKIKVKTLTFPFLFCLIPLHNVEIEICCCFANSIRISDTFVTGSHSSMKNIFEQVIEIEEKTYSLKNVVLKITLISI